MEASITNRTVVRANTSVVAIGNRPLSAPVATEIQWSCCLKMDAITSGTDRPSNAPLHRMRGAGWGSTARYGEVGTTGLRGL